MMPTMMRPTPAGTAISMISDTSLKRMAAAISASPKMMRLRGNALSFRRAQLAAPLDSASGRRASGKSTHHDSGMSTGASGRNSRTSSTLATT